MRIKVCGMKDPENITELLLLEPDYIGFIFYERSPRYVSNALPNDLLNAWPADTKKVGVFVNESTETVLRKVEEFELDLVQLHGNEAPEEITTVQAQGTQVIKVIHLKSGNDLLKVKDYAVADYFLFDTPSPQYGGTGQTFDWKELQDYDNSKPYFLSGGLDENNIAQIEGSGIPKPFGIDVNSKFEIEPGLKDINKLTALFKSIRHGIQH